MSAEVHEYAGHYVMFGYEHGALVVDEAGAIGIIVLHPAGADVAWDDGHRDPLLPGWVLEGGERVRPLDSVTPCGCDDAGQLAGRYVEILGQDPPFRFGWVVGRYAGRRQVACVTDKRDVPVGKPVPLHQLRLVRDLTCSPRRRFLDVIAKVDDALKPAAGGFRHVAPEQWALPVPAWELARVLQGVLSRYLANLLPAGFSFGDACALARPLSPADAARLDAGSVVAWDVGGGRMMLKQVKGAILAIECDKRGGGNARLLLAEVPSCGPLLLLSGGLAPPSPAAPAPSALGEVAARYPEWRGLVEQWPALEESYRRELPTGDAPETYALMKAIEEASR